MARTVRNAYIAGDADGAARFGTGPRDRDGWLAADVTLRTASGDVSAPIRLTAGGRWHGTDGQTDGRADAPVAAHAYLSIPGTFRVFTEPRADGGIDLHIVQREGLPR